MKNKRPTIQITSHLLTTLLLLCSHSVMAKGDDIQRGSVPGFIENKGQVTGPDGEPRPDILFTARSEGVRVFIGKQGLHYKFTKSTMKDGPERWDRDTGTVTTHRLDMTLVGSDPDPKVVRGAPTGYHENHYSQHHPEGITNVESYGKVMLEDVYPGIDWVLRREGAHMKHEFIVQPGADPKRIRMRFEGAENIEVTRSGGLEVTTSLGVVREDAPVSYSGVEEEEVGTRFLLEGDTVSFELSSSKDGLLRVDPVLEWGTYYGGGDNEVGHDLAVDDSGNVYMIGGTSSNTNISSGGHQNTYQGQGDAYLVKFDTSGVRQWATYYGGGQGDVGEGCALDTEGNLYLAGRTQSSMGIASGGFQGSLGGAHDAFLVKFDRSGVREWGTYYGGAEQDAGWSCSSDKKGGILIAGQTESLSGIATVGSHQDTLRGTDDAFLVRFDTSGARQWGTYYGGDSVETSSSCITDASGNPFLSGRTSSDNGIAFNGHQDTLGGKRDAFLVKFDASGQRQWGTYYGGAEHENSGGCSTDDSGNVYLTAATASNMNIAQGGLDGSLDGVSDAFLAKFDSSGTRLWGRYFGGSMGGSGGGESGSYCIVDNGRVYLTGQTSSYSGLATTGAYQDTLGGGWNDNDAFLAEFDLSGSLLYSTYFGGGWSDQGWACATSGSRSVYLAGDIGSDRGALPGGHQSTYQGNNEAFLLKFDMIASTVHEFGDRERPSLRVWPNPTTDRVMLSIPGKRSPRQARIHDLRGKVVSTISLQLGDDEIDVSGLPCGLYLLEVTDQEGERYRERLIVR